MSYVVAVPSYNRVDGCRDNTLTCLKNGGVPKDKIYLFVANEEEKKQYSDGIPKELYGHLVVGVKGLQQQRNFIGDYFKLGQHIVQMDDDVKTFKKIALPEGATKKRDLKAKLVEITNLPKLFEVGFDECKSHKAHLWGVAPVANAGFMKDEVDYGLVFCPGWAWGVINRRIPLQLPAQDGSFKEDYERTLQNAVVDGGVVRLSGVCGITKMYAKGGLDTSREKREEANRRNVKRLMERYPKLVFVKKMPKKAELEGTEIRLARKVPESERKSLAEVMGGRQPAATRPSDSVASLTPSEDLEGSGAKPDPFLSYDDFKKKYFSNLDGKTNKRMSAEVKAKLKDASAEDKEKYITKLWEDIKTTYAEEKKTRSASQKELKDADISDKNNAEVGYVPIRNSAKFEGTREALLEALRTSTKKLPGVASRTQVIGKDSGETAEGGKKPEAETITFGFGSIQGKGHGFFATNLKYPKIYEKCIEFGNQCVPKGWKYNAITLNHNTKTKVHIDGYNVGRSVIVGIGDYTGGDIRVWEPPDEEFFKEGKETAKKGARKSANQMLKENLLDSKYKSKTFNIKNRPLMFNGGLLPHATEPFVGNAEKGKGRYTLIFYSHSKLPPSSDSEANQWVSGTLGVGKGKVGAGLPQPTDHPMA